MVKYQRNNIVFRIASSDAISKFKATQSHAFLQLTRSDIAFDESAKEVVLLEYDRISQWLYRIERILLSSDLHKAASPLRAAITESFREEILTIENVIDAHSGVFTKDVNEYTKLIHAYAFAPLVDKIEKCLSETSVPKAFMAVAELMSNYLQHVLVCMHEYNNNVITNKCTPFLCLSDSCVALEPETDVFIPLVKRANFFKSKTDCSTFMFKDYSSRIHPFEEASKALAPLKITLTKETV